MITCSLIARPAWASLVINAMCAVTEMLIPIQAEYYALEGLGQLINTIGLVQEHFNPRTAGVHHARHDVRSPNVIEP